VEDERQGFWQSVFGKIFRWAFFLPVGFILTAIIQFIVIVGTLWLFDGDLRFFIIVGVLFGALFSVLPLICISYYYAIILAVGKICPSPKIGSIIFGTLYFLSEINSLIDVFAMNGGAGVVAPTLILKIILIITAGASLVFIYQEA
jgi:hypothetical protein